MLRILMFPGIGNKNENKYIDILVSNIERRGISIRGWNKYGWREDADVLHVHWPEVISDIYSRQFHSVRGIYIAHNFDRTIHRLKSRGGKVIWTVHDIIPHRAELANSPFHAALMARFLPTVDGVISLTSSGVQVIKDAYPILRHKPFFVCRHPHYREVYSGGGGNPIARRHLGARSDQKVLCFIGTFRKNKRIDLLVQAFKALPQKFFLVLAGGGSPQIIEAIRSELHDCPNVWFSSGRVPDSEIPRLYGAADALVFPGTDYFNSGTIYTALSFNVPVIAAQTPANEELQNLVGSRWLQTYPRELTASVLAKAMNSLATRENGEICDLTMFAPDVCADQHVAAYRELCLESQR